MVVRRQMLAKLTVRLFDMILRNILSDCSDRKVALRRFRWNTVGAVFYATIPATIIVICVQQRIFSTPLAVPLLAWIAISTPFYLVGWVCFRQRKALTRSRTLPEIAAEQQVDPEALETWIATNHIAPRFVIADQRLFDPVDFDPSRVLLRASRRPGQTGASLLRPASSTEPGKAEDLLHPLAQ